MKTPEYLVCLLIAITAGLAGDFSTAKLFFAAMLIIGTCAK